MEESGAEHGFESVVNGGRIDANVQRSAAKAGECGVISEFVGDAVHPGFGDGGEGFFGFSGSSPGIVEEWFDVGMAWGSLPRVLEFAEASEGIVHRDSRFRVVLGGCVVMESAILPRQ